MYELETLRFSAFIFKTGSRIENESYKIKQEYSSVTECVSGEATIHFFSFFNLTFIYPKLHVSDVDRRTAAAAGHRTTPPH